MKVAKCRLRVINIISMLIVLFSTFGATASEAEGKFNPGNMIMHHIADAHEIHLMGDAAIYLPVILYTESGFKIFSSSHFYHNQNTQDINGELVSFYEHDNFIMHHETIYYKGEGTPLTGIENGHLLNSAPIDFSITKTIFGMLLVLTLMVIVFIGAAKKYKNNPGKAPSGLQNALEPFILFIRDEVARPSIGKHADRFVPFLLTVFFFIWISNMLGLIPFLGAFNITGTIAVTAVLALFVLVITTINGNGHYWSHIFWPPGVPLPIKFILIPIEAAQIIIKPFVLMVRLTANITAGHIIILAFVSLALLFGESSAAAGYGVGAGAVAFMVFMFFLELLVAFLQAYVFTLLAALYFGDATQEAHH